MLALGTARPRGLAAIIENMLDWTAVERSHVLLAIEECDRLGCESFLRKYRYSPARAYHVVHEGQKYPSKAILAVAYLRATGDLPGPVRVDGGRSGAARVLRKLGFEVTGN